MRNPAIKSKPAPAGTNPLETARSFIPGWLPATLLLLVTVVLFWPATRYDFVNYDDDLYVTSNIHVQSGLTLENVKWVFLNPVSANWHPLTMLSHLFDCQVFGLKPWGHHLMNVLFHALNAALVFALFRQLTGATWRSLLVAALFAFHPLRVESVAWVAERKDVLSGFFGLLALIFYARYAQRSRVESRGSGAGDQVLAPDTRRGTPDYPLALFCLTLGLLSKPMLVTWPFVMLLLDYWPLERFQSRSAWRLMREKIPFLVMAVAAGIVAFVVQKREGSLSAMENLPLAARSGNALISCCRYLGKLFWPTDLAVFYPHPGFWPIEEVLLAGGLIIGISVLFFVHRRRYPFLLMGWLWFVGTLVPVIGLVQVGGQAMADRYTYLPSLGVLILVVWGAPELTRRWPYQVIAFPVTGLTVVVLCLALTRQQLEYWPNSETLFRHALKVTEKNFVAHNNLGIALDAQGRSNEAINQYQEAIRLKPDFTKAIYNLGNALDHNGQTEAAISQYREAIRLKPDYAIAYNNLGFALDKTGQIDEAISQYREAIRLKPDCAEAHDNLGFALERKGQIDEAISQSQEAIQLKPDYAKAYSDLGTALAARGRFDEAIGNFQKASQIDPRSSDALHNLGVALAARGRLDEAVTNLRKAGQIDPTRPETFFHLGMTLGQLGRTREAVVQYREALRLNPNLVGALNNLAWILTTSPDDQLRNGAEAVRLAGHACELTHYGQPLFIGTLAAAYAECGRFPEAVATAEKAERLATNAGLTAVAATNRQLLELYRAGKPYHEPTTPKP